MTLRLRDYLLLAAFSLFLFGFSMFSGAPLSLHSARLPECSREMMSNHDWFIPRSGGRPWLERPPLPHWITIATSALLGQHCDSVWVVRLPAALAGMSITLITAWIAGVLLGRTIGLCGGFVLATAYEFWRYSTLSEDDIFLAVLVVAALALFVRSEFIDNEQRTGFFGIRRWSTFAFFLVAGLTNLAKGPLVGAAVVFAPIGVYLLLPEGWTPRWSRRWQFDLHWSRDDCQKIRRYLWLWGIVIFLALTAFWPYMIYRRYPDTLHNWLFDYSGTEQYDEKPWYYLLQLPGVFIPWTPAVFVGMWMLAPKWKENRTRFLWCWAVVPIIVLSIPHRKHHHYLVPSLAPWAVFGAVGLQQIGKWLVEMPAKYRKTWLGILLHAIPGALTILLWHKHIPGPMGMICALAAIWIVCVLIFYRGLQFQRPVYLLIAMLTGLSTAYCWGQVYMLEDIHYDTEFLLRANNEVPHDVPLFINGDLGGEHGPHGEMDFFRNQFYSRADAQLLHNLTFLRDERIKSPIVYVITRASDEPQLEDYGTVDPVAASERTRRERSPADRFTLFKLTFNPNLHRYPAPSMDSITTMQAMGRAEGPFCGPNE